MARKIHGYTSCNTSLVLNLASRAREHRITTGSGGSGDFLLQYGIHDYTEMKYVCVGDVQ
jgi:hypothetical protein